jgi:probable phosphoglycerate mutase
MIEPVTEPLPQDDQNRRTVARGLGGVVDQLDGLCELVLVRHGQQETLDYGVVGRGSRYDPGLSERGTKQAEAVAERLASTKVDAVYTSPLARARSTANAIAGRHDLVPIVKDDLSELNLWGQLSPDANIADLYTREDIDEFWLASMTARKYSGFPHVEDMERFKDRLFAAIGRIASAHADERVVITCHGGVVNGFLARIFKSPLDVLVAVRNASITVAQCGEDRAPVVLTVNETSHLNGLDD